MKRFEARNAKDCGEPIRLSLVLSPGAEKES